MKFLKQFKFLISFFLAIISAIFPSFYTEYKQKINQKINESKIIFSYELSKDIGLEILQKRYGHLGSIDSLVEKYKNLVEREFKKQKFTVKKVINQQKVQIPMKTAISLFKKIHIPTIEMISKPYVVKFTITNKSNKQVYIKKVVISTDDVYPNPVWDISYDYPCENNCQIRYNFSNPNGYILKFNKKFLLPKENKLTLFIFFPNKPIIRQNKTFVDVTDTNNKDFLVYLTTPQKIINFLFI